MSEAEALVLAAVVTIFIFPVAYAFAVFANMWVSRRDRRRIKRLMRKQEKHELEVIHAARLAYEILRETRRAAWLEPSHFSEIFHDRPARNPVELDDEEV